MRTNTKFVYIAQVASLCLLVRLNVRTTERKKGSLLCPTQTTSINDFGATRLSYACKAVLNVSFIVLVVVVVVGCQSESQSSSSECIAIALERSLCERNINF